MDQGGQYKTIYTELKHKDNSTSDKWRVKGNEYYKKSGFHDAIICYNIAIAFAKTNEFLSLAYGNRSAAYLQVKKYRECIENIKLARECGYPTEKLQNLKEREEKCLKLIENDKEEENLAKYVWDFFKLSYPANKKIPWITEDLDAKEKGQYSKGVYATRDLKAGDIIAIEDINMFQTDNDGNFKHCSYCFKTNMLNLIPCLKTANFIFCSTECRDEFYKHADGVISQEPIFNHYTVYISKMRETFGGIKELLSNIKLKSKNLFDFDFSDPETSQYNKYKCLITSYDLIYFELINRLNFASKFFLTIEGFLSNNSLSYIHTLPSSSSCGWADDGTFFSYFAFAMKSSCTRNVHYVCIDNKCVFYVEKPIKAGEELFISLAGPWYSKSIEERKRNFLTKNCKCVACTENLTAKYLRFINLLLVSQIIKDYQLNNDDVLSMISTAKNRFDLLNIPEFNVLTSMERRMAIDDIIKTFRHLAFKIMFPY